MEPSEALLLLLIDRFIHYYFRKGDGLSGG